MSNRSVHCYQSHPSGFDPAMNNDTSTICPHVLDHQLLISPLVSTGELFLLRLHFLFINMVEFVLLRL